MSTMLLPMGKEESLIENIEMSKIIRDSEQQPAPVAGNKFGRL